MQHSRIGDIEEFSFELKKWGENLCEGCQGRLESRRISFFFIFKMIFSICTVDNLSDIICTKFDWWNPDRRVSILFIVHFHLWSATLGNAYRAIFKFVLMHFLCSTSWISPYEILVRVCVFFFVKNTKFFYYSRKID